MSLFLGPIHYWLYNKIQVQQGFVDEMIALGKVKWALDLQPSCNEKFGETERRELDQVIDGGNIHGWLQEQVARTEYQLAYCVTEILNKDGEAMEDLTSLFEKMGKKLRNSLEEDVTTIELFQVIHDTLLDGMPCDHVNEIIEKKRDKVIWRRRTCIHKHYWETVGGQVQHYYELREAWLRGFVQSKASKFEKLDEVTYAIKVK